MLNLPGAAQGEDKGMALVTVAGGALDVTSVGEGPDLVLLHSLLIDRPAFARVVPTLAKHRRVHLVALPGFDGSTQAGPGVEDYADRIPEALRLLGLGRGSAVLGNGFGGFVAVALAARHGRLFEKLWLVDTAAGFPAAAKTAFALMADKVAGGGMGAVAEIAARRTFHDAYLARHPEAVAERRAVLMRFNAGAFIAACRALERVDLTATLSRIVNRTLVVVGELDAATPLDRARAGAADRGRALRAAAGVRPLPAAGAARVIPGCGGAVSRSSHSLSRRPAAAADMDSAAETGQISPQRRAAVAGRTRTRTGRR
jgi:3-oxoadipate enol-lactonase